MNEVFTGPKSQEVQKKDLSFEQKNLKISQEISEELYKILDLEIDNI